MPTSAILNTVAKPAVDHDQKADRFKIPSTSQKRPTEYIVVFQSARILVRSSGAALKVQLSWSRQKSIAKILINHSASRIEELMNQARLSKTDDDEG